MEGALDDVAKQLDKQTLEDKDDDDEGKCNFFFHVTLPVSAFSWTSILTNLQRSVFLFGKNEVQLYIHFLIFLQQFSCHACMYV